MKTLRKSTLLALAATTLLWTTGTMTIVTVTSSTASAQTNSAFLSGLTEAVAADPGNAAAIVAAALEEKKDEIEATPGLALDIVLAVIAGLPADFMTANVIAGILDAAVGVLDTLPPALSNVSSDVLRAVLASLPPELSSEVRQLISSGGSGVSSSLQTQLNLLEAVVPPGGIINPTPTPSEDETTDEDDMTEVTPG